MKFLYSAHGESLAFSEGTYVYNMQGYAVGFIEHTHVYRLSGEYVGELYQDMVVDTYDSHPGPSGPFVDPGRVPPADAPGSRGPYDYGYPDRLPQLLQGESS